MRRFVTEIIVLRKRRNLADFCLTEEQRFAEMDDRSLVCHQSRGYFILVGIYPPEVYTFLV